VSQNCFEKSLWHSKENLATFLGSSNTNKKGIYMSLFSNILSKLGVNRSEAKAAPAASSPTAAPAAANTQKLNWKTSIVDLLKLLDLDSSLTARKELAAELACPADKMADSAQMNMWLHKTVLQKLADNGGNIPKDLLA